MMTPIEGKLVLRRNRSISVDWRFSLLDKPLIFAIRTQTNQTTRPKKLRQGRRPHSVCRQQKTTAICKHLATNHTNPHESIQATIALFTPSRDTQPVLACFSSFHLFANPFPHQPFWR